ncbi:unnamed protein product (macronuclear) [Paramecium tetraurelia]|uniref:Cilia- and flagella-associated protein 157 n=1 Tax=Paramecium tetraurelia TaxID=5888 RepID=A0EIK8_PARTE|nr:uncharacterized protein GSPATT00027478001 [Paramecium tetraurelia]CAK95149.1 unnamed protein product [Paramecium tetraurelia]|eukprot:XP_001462522.1 hypothetical protein (macronuclear) [Paramecium tetraurelia strain d4-2]
MKLSQTPQTKVSRMDETFSTDIHNMCYSRVNILTNEVEKLTDVLGTASQEMEVLKEQNRDLQNQLTEMEHSNQIVNQEFDNICERLKQKSIEAEEYAFQVQKLTLQKQEITQNLNKVLNELEQINQVIDIKDQEIQSGKQQFIAKTEELQQSLQQTYHLDQALKVVKEEKLKYIYEYQQLQKLVEEQQQQIKELNEYRIGYETLKVDLNILRVNYTNLLNQKLEEKKELEAQIDVLRDMHSYTIEDGQLKFADQIKQEIESFKQLYDEQYKFERMTYESTLDQLKNQVATLSMQLQNAEILVSTHKQNLMNQAQLSMFEKSNQVSELKAQNYVLQESLITANRELNELKQQMENGNIIRFDEDVRRQIEYKLDLCQQLQKDKEELNKENQQLKRENKLLKENNELMQQQLSQQQSNISQLPQSLLLSQISPSGISPGQKINDSEKIKYLLKAVDQLQNAIKDRDQEITKLSQMASTNVGLSSLINKPNSRMRFYHLNSDDLNSFDKQL